LSLRAIGDRVNSYAKKAFEDAARAFEQLVGAASIDSLRNPIVFQEGLRRVAGGGLEASARCMPPLPATLTSQQRKQWLRELPSQLLLADI
jgi:hypothetical protein